MDLINREDAIEVIKSLPNANPIRRYDFDVVDRKDAVNVLEDLPAVEPTQPNDFNALKVPHYVKREDVINALNAWLDDIDDRRRWFTVINDIPFADPEQKTGKWLWDKDETYYRCSECGHLAYETLYCIDGTYAYCPFCGAKMEGGEDE